MRIAHENLERWRAHGPAGAGDRPTHERRAIVPPGRGPPHHRRVLRARELDRSETAILDAAAGQPAPSRGRIPEFTYGCIEPVQGNLGWSTFALPFAFGLRLYRSHLMAAADITGITRSLLSLTLPIFRTLRINVHPTAIAMNSDYSVLC